jgi:hypothetical protein
VIVLCCFSDLNVNTARSVKAQAEHAIFEDVSTDPFAYWEAIKGYWTGSEDLMIVEHDVELVSGNEVASFLECGKDWCTYSYPGPYVGNCTNQTMFGQSLGCTKFSKELQRIVSIREEPQRLWTRIDNFLRASVQQSGFVVHNHGVVKHHHGYGRLPTSEEQEKLWHERLNNTNSPPGLKERMRKLRGDQ